MGFWLNAPVSELGECVDYDTEDDIQTDSCYNNKEGEVEEEFTNVPAITLSSDIYLPEYLPTEHTTVNIRKYSVNIYAIQGETGRLLLIIIDKFTEEIFLSF